jgi:hypothetical protein
MSQIHSEIIQRRMIEPLYSRMQFVYNLLSNFNQNRDVIVANVQTLDYQAGQMAHALSSTLNQVLKSDIFKLKMDIMKTQKYLIQSEQPQHLQTIYEDEETPEIQLTAGEQKAIREAQKDLQKGRAFETNLFHNGKRLYTGSTGGYFYYNNYGKRTYVKNYR